MKLPVGKPARFFGLLRFWRNPKSKEAMYVAAISIAGFFAALIMAGFIPYNDVLEIGTIKLRFAARGELDPNPLIRIIAMDDNSISELGGVGINYPFPRALHGKLLKRLADAGVRAVCFDILFDLESSYGPEDDLAFKEAIEYAKSKGTNVVLSAAIPFSSSSGYRQATLITPNETLLSAPVTLGLANTSIKGGERGKGAYRDKELAVLKLLDQFHYSQAAEMFRLYLLEKKMVFVPEEHGVDRFGFMYVNYFNGNYKHIATIQFLQMFPEVAEGVNPLTGESMLGADEEWETGETAKRLGLVSEEGWDEPEEDGEAVGKSVAAESDSDGGEELAGVVEDSGEIGMVGDELPQQKQSPQTRITDLQGTFVFVGSFSEADNDFFATPFSDKMAGVETNAQAFQTFLTGEHIRIVPAWITFVLFLLGSLVAGYFAFYIKRRTTSLLLAILFMVVSATAIVYAFVFWRILLAFTFSSFSFPLSYTLVLTFKLYSEEQDKAKIRRTFGRYVSEAVVNEIIDNPELAEMSGIRREVAVLFSDIRNFSPISERMDPADVLLFLNEYFESTSNIIDANGGYVDKFMGDGIMAVFGAPVPRENPSLDAVRCALEMIRNLKENVHPRMDEIGVPRFLIGVGIHYGEVIMGNIGSMRRADYSIIGDAVNLASRLEGTTKEYKKAVVISEEVKQKVDGHFPCTFLARMRVKGREREEHVYAVDDPDLPGLTDLV